MLLRSAFCSRLTVYVHGREVSQRAEMTYFLCSRLFEFKTLEYGEVFWKQSRTGGRGGVAVTSYGA